MSISINQNVQVHVNSVLGHVPAKVVRNVTGTSVASTANPLDGEPVFEVRYTAGIHRGEYTFAPKRNLRQILTFLGKSK